MTHGFTTVKCESPTPNFGVGDFLLAYDTYCMKFKSFILEERELGRPLSEVEPQYQRPGAKVSIYRGVLANQTQFNTNDYVTLSYKFAKEHAQHTAEYESMLAHVLRARVLASQVFEAYNPGEYFYGGPMIIGEIVYRAKST